VARRIVITTAPRLGIGVGLLGFVVWIFAMLLWACWMILQVLVVGAVILIGLVVEWVSPSKRGQPEQSS